MVSRSSIDEANRHLQALHSRVQQLEKTVGEQNESLTAKDEMANKLQEISEIKDVEITELTAKLLSAKEKVKAAENTLKEKDQLLQKLQERCRVLDRVMGYQPVLENLLTTLACGGSLSDSGISASDTPPLENQSHHTVKSYGYKGSAIRRMAKNFNSHAGRRKQFSISEDDDEDRNADTEGDSSDEKSPERELYL